MPPSVCHLPNGQNITVTPVFGGLSFKVNDLSNSRSAFPPGWSIVLNEEDEEEEGQEEEDMSRLGRATRRHTIHRWRRPTLKSDHLFISSISSPSSSDFKPATSPTRQIAMMLW